MLTGAPYPNFNPNLPGPARDERFLFETPGGVSQIHVSLGGGNATITERACADPIDTPGPVTTLCTDSAGTHIETGPNRGPQSHLNAFQQSSETGTPEPAGMLSLRSGLPGLGVLRLRDSWPMAAVAIVALGSGLLAQTGIPATIVIQSQPASTIAYGFSGFNTPQPRNGVEYFDPKFLAAATPLKGGWVRYPAGTASMAFDWNPASPTGGHINIAWMNSLIQGNPPAVTGQAAGILTISQQLTQAKGGVWLFDFANFADTLGAASVLCFNTYTDDNPGSATQMALAAKSYGLHVVEWELGNEAYLYPVVYPSAPAYAASVYNPYFKDVIAGAPTATAGLFYAGQYPGTLSTAFAPTWFPSWDAGMQGYTPQYWNAASNHIYPIVSPQTAQNTMWTLNGLLAYGSSDYITSYLVPLMGPGTPIYITEFNCCSDYSNKFLTYLYNGIFMAEYTARLSTVPNVKAVGVNSLYTDNSDYHGLIQSVNDFESYLIGQVEANPDYSTNTATNPLTQFQFYTSAPGLAMEVANQAINSGNQLLPTTVAGGPTVQILGFDGNPIPAIYA